MAESLKDHKSYFTRSKKSSIDTEESTEDVKEKNEVITAVIDLTQFDETEDAPSCKEGGGSECASPECAICLQSCVHPARLPCGHIFCFLCLKGVAHGSRRCAMCRNPIPPNYFDNPDLLDSPMTDNLKTPADHEGYEWFYEGRHGWWQYDPRTSVELERAYLADQSECELLIAGYIYTIDLEDGFQIRKGQPSRRRKIKRDLASSEKLGVAGLRDPRLAERTRRHSTDDKEVATSATEPPLEPADLWDGSGARRESLQSEDARLSGGGRVHLWRRVLSLESWHSLLGPMASLSVNNSDDEDSYQ